VFPPGSMRSFSADGLSKTYRVSDKQAGLGGTPPFLPARSRDVQAAAMSTSRSSPEENRWLSRPQRAGKTTTLKDAHRPDSPSAGRGRWPLRSLSAARPAFLPPDHPGDGPEAATDMGSAAADSLRVNRAVYASTTAKPNAAIDELAGQCSIWARSSPARCASSRSASG